MIGGKLDAAGLALLAPERREPLRPPPTMAEAESRAAAHREAVMRECLEIAIRSLGFAALPTTRQDLRVIRGKLAAAGVEVKA